jgi:hypothetical protein
MAVPDQSPWLPATPISIVDFLVETGSRIPARRTFESQGNLGTELPPCYGGAVQKCLRSSNFLLADVPAAGSAFGSAGDGLASRLPSNALHHSRD